MKELTTSKLLTTSRIWSTFIDTQPAAIHGVAKSWTQLSDWTKQNWTDNGELQTVMFRKLKTLLVVLFSPLASTSLSPPCQNVIHLEDLKACCPFSVALPLPGSNSCKAFLARFVYHFPPNSYSALWISASTALLCVSKMVCSLELLCEWSLWAWLQLTFRAVGPSFPLYGQGHVYLRAFARSLEDTLHSSHLWLLHPQLLAQAPLPHGRSSGVCPPSILFSSFIVL